MKKPSDEELRRQTYGIRDFEDLSNHVFAGHEMHNRSYHAGETTWTFPEGIREKIKDDRLYDVWYTKHYPSDPYDTSSHYRVYYIKEI